MSAIQKELAKATDLDAPKNAAARQDFLVDVLKAVGKLPDDEWNKLSPEAQNWFNDAADAKNAKAKELPDFPDMAEEEEPAPRRRGSAKEEEAAPKAGTKVEVKAKELEVGMAISLVTKRGKEDTGHVVEVSVKDGVLAIKRGDGEEVEYDLERIESMHTLAAAKEEPTTSRRKSAEPDEPETPELAVGDEVTVTTLRGKEATGEIVELTDDIVVLKEGKEEVEYARDRVKSIVPTKAKGKAASKEDDAPKRRGAAKDDKAVDKGDEKTKRASNDGISVGTRIKELIIDDMDRSEEDIAKLLKKEGLEFRDNTLKLNYKDTHKFLDLLKSKKMLKA